MTTITYVMGTTRHTATIPTTSLRTWALTHGHVVIVSCRPAN